MRGFRRLASVIMSFVMVLALSLTAFAADPAANNLYTIRVYSGGQGTFSNGNTEIIIKAAPGTTLDLSDTLKNVTMTTKSVFNAGGETVTATTTATSSSAPESKYYAKGIRESGKDNNTVDTLTGPIFVVTQDIDYVVAYAMKGGDVQYTVRFVSDETGESLAPDEVYYGNVGEKPVVACKHIDGYVPQAYNLAKTLKEDASENVLTFRYVPGDSSYWYYEEDGGVRYYDTLGEIEYDYTPGNVVYIQGGDGGVRVIPGNGGNGGNRGNAGGNAAGGAAAGGAAADAAAADGAEAGAEETIPENTAPATLIDLDDEASALAGGIKSDVGADEGVLTKITDFASPLGDLSVGAKIGISGVTLAVLVSAAYMALFHRKKEETDEEE